MINEIKGNNIILREQKIEDVKFFTYWYNQPLVMFQCGFTKLTDEEAEKVKWYNIVVTPVAIIYNNITKKRRILCHNDRSKNLAKNADPNQNADLILHSDQGSQFTSKESEFLQKSQY